MKKKVLSHVLADAVVAILAGIVAMIVLHSSNSSLTGSAVTLSCGNGVKEGREQCDDGNRVGGDGCDPRCNVVSAFYDCDGGSPTRCTLKCGNGTKQGAEQCDDGNANNGDGCRSDCRPEAGFQCSGSPSVCQKCGNGKQEGTEQCDDGNRTNHDGCSSVCRQESGSVSSSRASSASSTSSVGNTQNGLSFEWTAEPSLPVNIREAAITVALGKMWVIAGYDPNSKKDPLPNKVYMTTDGKTWTQWGALPYGMYGASAIEWNGALWVVGGIKCGSQTSCYAHQSFYSYDGITWKEGPTVPGSFIIYKHSLFVLDGKLFLGAQKMYSLESITSSWQAAGSSNGGSAVTFQGKAWMISGQSVMSFNGTGGWSSQSVLPEKLTTLPPQIAPNPGMLVVHGNYLLAVGNSPDPQASVQYPNCFKTILSSLDGVQWSKSQTSPCWSPLRDETTLSFKNKLSRIGEVFDSGKVYSGQQQ